MHHLALFLLLILSAGASADLCPEIEKRSSGRIGCRQDDFGYTLKYHDWFARKLVIMSGQYPELIKSLCEDGGGVIRETWKPPFAEIQLRTTHCQ